MRRENKLLRNMQISVMGVGGGGSSAVNHMITSGFQGVQFISIHTDYQHLAKSNASTRILIGKQVTQGLGTGSRPVLGRRAAFESRQEIMAALRGTDALFIATGLGGGTGSGASPIIAQIAREMGILTIAVVTRPFRFEGSAPTQIAKDGIQELAEYVDSLIVFPNDRLLNSSDEQTSLKEAYRLADSVISQGVQVIYDFVNLTGLINLDFANLKSIMTKKGATLITVGRAQGIDRARIAAERALVCPILGLNIHGARGMLINITASSNLDLRETQTITRLLQNTTHLGADFILGTVIDETMGDEIRVTVVATGFCNEIWDDWSYPEQPRRKTQPAVVLPPQPKINPSKPTIETRNKPGFSLRSFPIPAFLQSS